MKTIPLINLLYCLIPLAIVWFYYRKWTNNSVEIIYATVRMVLQLLIIGYLLVYIFEQKNSLIESLILLFMICVSALITIHNVKNKNIKTYSLIFTSIFISGLFHLILAIVFVLKIELFYKPQYVIPIAGMIFANCMNVLSIGIERFEKEFAREGEFESARSIAFKAALIPQINSFLAVGLVSLPGMMTGQILSGIDPLIAVRYQIMIMAIILSTAGITNIIYFTLKQRFQ